jgi:MFS transporter, DHA2 family, multidrug resistance protein
MSDPNQKERWQPTHNPWAIALTVTIATFMEVMDISIANVALQHIAGGLSAGLDESTWVLTSYLVSNAIVLPISAWLVDRFGRKRFYMTCVALFTASSLLCGIAPSLGMLIFFRILQGAGGGGLAPSEQAIIADTFPPEKRGMGFAVYGVAVVLAPAIGPTLGGWITDYYSWRWIFFINIPFGLLSLFLVNIMIEDPPYLEKAKAKARKVGADWLGLGLIATSLATLQVVLDKGQRDDWFASNFIVTFSIISATCMLVFLVWDWNHANPVINLKLFKNRSFAVATTMMFTFGVLLLGTTVLIPQFLQSLLGYTAERAGEVLSPGAIVVVLLLPIVGLLVSKSDTRYLIAFGMFMEGLAMFTFSNVTLDMDFRTAVYWRMFQGIGLAFLFIPVNTISYTDVPADENNQVSGMMNVMRNLGGSVGISFITTFLARRAQFHENRLVDNIYGGYPWYRKALGATVATFSRHGGSSTAHAVQQAYGRIVGVVQQQASLLSYVDTVYLLGILALIATPLVFIAKRVEPGKAHMGH